MKIADKNEFEKQNLFGTGTPNTAYLNRVAVTTGTFTTQRAAAVSFSSARQVRVGIRKKAKSL